MSSRSSFAVDETFGLGVIDQVDPFHRSNSVRSASEADSDVPDAMQNVEVTHETEDRESSTPGLSTLGLGTTDQALPFHCSTKVPATGASTGGIANGNAERCREARDSGEVIDWPGVGRSDDRPRTGNHRPRRGRGRRTSSLDPSGHTDRTGHHHQRCRQISERSLHDRHLSAPAETESDGKAAANGHRGWYSGMCGHPGMVGHARFP